MSTAAGSSIMSATQASSAPRSASQRHQAASASYSEVATQVVAPPIMIDLEPHKEQLSGADTQDSTKHGCFGPSAIRSKKSSSRAATQRGTGRRQRDVAIAQRKRQEAGLAPMVVFAAPEVSKEEIALRFQRMLTESERPLLISVICEAKTMGHMAASKWLLVRQKPEGRYCCPCNKRADDMHVSGWQHQQAVLLFFGCVVASLAMSEPNILALQPAGT